jgi:hypothetical protein
MRVRKGGRIFRRIKIPLETPEIPQRRVEGIPTQVALSPTRTLFEPTILMTVPFTGIRNGISWPETGNKPIRPFGGGCLLY